ncbi:MAG: hypothetical protein IJW06_03595 [Clostridia bacterium]|nr:hypothetical protein [Clostridia bacterium]
MDRFAKFLCDPARVVKTIIALLVCIGIVVYVYLQVIGTFDRGIVTETAMYVTLNDTITADACIFRDETILENDGNGAIVTLVSEGERVSKGQLIANIYPDEKDARLQDDINRINRRLEILQNSSVDKQFVISDLRQLDDDIDEVFADIYEDAAKGNLSSAITSSSELLVRLNKRDLIVESDFDYSQELENLEKEKKELEGQIKSVATPLYAENSGYFFGDVDGYEQIFDVSLVDTLTLSDFEKLIASEGNEEKASGSVKIVNDFVWNIVCSVDAQQARTLKEGREYTLSFPENADYEMTMTLSKIVSETNSKTSLAVFRVNVLPRDFNYKRFQNAEIVIKDVEGISVPKKALRVVNGVEGVYILVGDVVRFRSVERIAVKDGYYVVRIQSNTEVFEEDGQQVQVKPLSLYDNVIVSGKDLFDGKIIG